MPHRYFTTEISDGTATLRGADAHHLARVMRARLGDTVILCDGNAVEYTATITGFGDECVEFRVEPGYPSAAEPSVEVTLLAGYPKQDKLEQIIQKSVELGVTRIVPVLTRRCISRPKPAEFQKKLPRLQKIAASAAKQAGRGIIPEVAPMLTFAQACAEMQQADRAILLYEGGGVRFDEADLHDCRSIALIVGSEGGFDPEEAEQLQQNGAVAVWLGHRILRCETAPLAAISIVMHRTGNL